MKGFFFEKKKQKTFIHWCRPVGRGATISKNLLVIFFKKELP
jgi:hypothetical protein